MSEKTQEQRVLHVLRLDNVNSVAEKTGRPVEELYQILDDLKKNDNSFVILVDEEGYVF